MGAIKADKDNTAEIDNITRINDAFGDILKMIISAQVADYTYQYLGKEK